MEEQQIYVYDLHSCEIQAHKQFAEIFQYGLHNVYST